MANILHRLTIDAPTDRVGELAGSTEGIEKWWTGRPVAGDDAVGERLSIHFQDPAEPAATFQVLECGSDRIVWRCVDGPQDWVGTRIVFALRSRADGGTTLLFTHEGWAQENEFMHGCSTNWAAYLMGLKAGAEGRGFSPFPQGEISRWN